MKLDQKLWEPEYLKAFGRTLTRYHVLARQLSDEVGEKLIAARVNPHGGRRYLYPFHPIDRQLTMLACERLLGHRAPKASATETRAHYLGRTLKMLTMARLIAATSGFESMLELTGPVDPEAQDQPSDARTASDCPTPPVQATTSRHEP